MSVGPAELLTTIVSNTYTVSDLDRRLGLLRGCVESALFTETDMSYLEECMLYLEKHASEVDMVAVKEWGALVLTAFTQRNVRTLIKNIYAASEAVSVFTIYLPCAFPDAEIKMIGDWCRREGESNVLLDVHVDASVVGGCAFVANDTYQEISFASRMQETPGLITNLLTQYAGK